MTLPDFRLLRPATLPEALVALAGPRATALGGGTDLLVALKQRRVAPELLVDLTAVGELGDVGTWNGGLTIGAGQAGDGGGGGFDNFWSGGLDEVRFFTFAQGAFSTSDLLYPTVPEPAALSLLGLALLGLWRRRA